MIVESCKMVSRGRHGRFWKCNFHTFVGTDAACSREVQ